MIRILLLRILLSLRGSLGWGRGECNKTFKERFRWVDMSDAVVGERGLKRHLDEKVILRKRGVEYTGHLGVHGDGKFFVGVDSIWEGPGKEDRKCENENARVYINEPGRDVVHLLGKKYCVGSGKRVDQFRDFRFVSGNPTGYKANRRRLSKEVPTITERGLKRNEFNYCSIRKPSGRGGYSGIRSGIIVSDSEEGDYVLFWMGSEEIPKIEDWDRIILSQRSRGGGRHLRSYTYRERQ